MQEGESLDLNAFRPSEAMRILANSLAHDAYPVREQMMSL